MTEKLALFEEWSRKQQAIEEWDRSSAVWQQRPRPLKFWLVGGPLWLAVGQWCRRKMVRQRQEVEARMPPDMAARVREMAGKDGAL